jgi:hypothetical protein
MSPEAFLSATARSTAFLISRPKVDDPVDSGAPTPMWFSWPASWAATGGAPPIWPQLVEVVLRGAPLEDIFDSRSALFPPRAVATPGRKAASKG